MSREKLQEFFHHVKQPLAVVSSLLKRDREVVVKFLLQLNIPVYLESISGLREDPRLQHLRIAYIHRLWENAAQADYPIDGILRLGGVPTLRAWRDLEEEKHHHVRVLSISHLPFRGMSRGQLMHISLLENLTVEENFNFYSASEWLAFGAMCEASVIQLFQDLPRAEPSLLYFLSQKIPKFSLVYLGNSSPIREWDLAATYQSRGLAIEANRGLNGIDGQISTFLGLCDSQVENWAILGDLTTLYDMAGPWILSQLSDISVTLVVINNGGGNIFSRMFPQKEFQNQHKLSFKPLADFWGLSYEKWTAIPEEQTRGKRRWIELVPDRADTDDFWKRYGHINSGSAILKA